jgi:hypothetical protein
VKERKKESTRKRMIPQQQRKICKLCFYESGLREREREREREDQEAVEESKKCSVTILAATSYCCLITQLIDDELDDEQLG